VSPFEDFQDREFDEHVFILRKHAHDGGEVWLPFPDTDTPPDHGAGKHWGERLPDSYDESSSTLRRGNTIGNEKMCVHSPWTIHPICG